MDSTTAKSQPDSRSLMGLFSDLWRETSTLFRKEAELAKVEMSEKLSEVGSAVASLAVGAAILFAGLLVLLIAVVNALAQVLPPEVAAWLSPLIVGVVVAGIGIAALAKARQDLKLKNLEPKRTMHSLRRDAQLAKEHMK